MHEVAKAGADAIEAASGPKYKIDNVPNAMYAAAGGSDDYAFGVKNIPIALTMELSAGGELGFDPPANQMRKSVAENWIGIRAMALKVDEKY